jgi:hypothetical protein
MIVDGTSKILLIVRDLTETMMKDAKTNHQIRVAENKTEVIRTLNYSVSHHVISLLQSISLLGDALLNEVGLHMNPQMRTIVETIVGAAKLSIFLA